MVSKDEIVKLLAGVEIFLKLQPEFLKAIAEVVEVREFPAGRKIVSQGEDGQEFFVIVSGAVDILVQDYAMWTEQKILELGPGKSFGETALLTAEKRSATVQTTEPTRCLVLSKDNFSKLMSRLAEVGVAVSSYLAQRLSTQCKLTGHRFLSIDELVYDPKLYRAIPETVLLRCQAIPVGLSGRTLTIALTRPNDFEVIRALQAEVPGFGLEPMACSTDDYLAFLYRHRGGAHTLKSVEISELAEVRLDDGQMVADPVRRLLLTMLGAGALHAVVDVEARSAQAWSKRGANLQPLMPAADAAQARSLRSYFDEMMGEQSRMSAVSRLALDIQGRPYQLSMSVLRATAHSRYSLELKDVKTAVPPLRSLLPSEGTFNLVRAAAHQQESILFWSGGAKAGITTSLYSLLEGLGDSLDLRNVLLLEQRRYVPHDRITQFPLSDTITPVLEAAVEQRPEILAFDALRPAQVRELLTFSGLDCTVIAGYAGDDLLDLLRGYYLEQRGMSAAWHRVSHSVRQRLARKICHACCEPNEPKAEQLAALKARGLANPEGSYFQGKGCAHCRHSGLHGVVPVLEAVIWNRALLERFDTVPTGTAVDSHLPEEQYAFTFQAFARLLLAKGMLEPLEALRLFGQEH